MSFKTLVPNNYTKEKAQLTMGRKVASMKNFIWSNVRTLVFTLMRFVVRTVFIKQLGETYLGVEGLFSNILGFLSLAELGISSAISFSLYKPLSENDTPKIQALMNFYKRAYRYVAGVVAVIGVVLIPFIPKIAKGAESIEHLQLIFCIYLFNTVSSYLITYKASIISADQKAYITSNIYLVSNAVTLSLQIVSLLLFNNFIVYLLIASVTGLVSNLTVYWYANRMYPYLKGKNKEQLGKEDSRTLFVKIKSLLYHKIGQVVISQTDSIITSSFINVNVVGFVANYNMIINVIKSLASTLFDVMIPSLGNLIATENVEYQKKVYRNVEFLNYWINSFTAVSLFFLLTPFIRIWIGEKFVLSDSLVLLFVVNYYIYISRLPIFSLRSAAGVFEPDRFSPIVESVINLVISIILAKEIGVVGVYIGTLVSSFVPYIWCPIVVYRYVFKDKCGAYFFRQITRLLCVGIYGTGMYYLFRLISFDNLFLNFLFRAVLCILVPNAFILVFYRKTEQFAYVVEILKKVLSKLKSGRRTDESESL